MLFSDDVSPAATTDGPATGHVVPWKVLIVDDEEEVHTVTKLVLRGFEFADAPLQFLHAHSASEARAALADHDDIAVALIDVVMEADDAGLSLVKHIREVVKNRDVRLVLRTGQPGQAPEERVIREFDINDYKNKTELTAIKLKTLLYSALRSYRDICVLNQHRAGLERTVVALGELTRTRTVNQFANAVLGQLANLIHLRNSAIYLNAWSLFAERVGGPDYRLIAVAGEPYASMAREQLESGLPEEVRSLLLRAFEEKRSLIDGHHYVGFFRTKLGSENLLFVNNGGDLKEMDHRLLDLFCANVGVTYENLLLHEEIEASQQEMIFMLCEAVEKRSRETGGHVKRVSALSAMLAEGYGLAPRTVELIRYAAPLHDIGKVGIPDHILNKPGRHTPEEWEVMRTHAQLGEAILARSQQPMLKVGATIAAQHHERWDGRGYPHGYRGEEIDIAARIVALADVFDALGSERCYKSAWAVADIVAYLKRESGGHFEPRLVDLLLGRLDFALELRERYPDA
jgi:response regulator RpfG family c-di-GMP phosphodiesterase